MFAAFRGELFKVVRRPGVWVLVIVLLVLAILIGYAITWLIYTFPPKGASQGLPAGTSLSDFKVTLYPANFVRQTLGQWGVLGGVFALIVGVLMQGSEYGWGTMKTLYTQRSGRLTMLFGKVAAMAVVVFVMVIALFAVDAASSTVVALIDGKTISYPDATTTVKPMVACSLSLVLGPVRAGPRDAVPAVRPGDRPRPGLRAGRRGADLRPAGRAGRRHRET